MEHMLNFCVVEWQETENMEHGEEAEQSWDILAPSMEDGEQKNALCIIEWVEAGQRVLETENFLRLWFTKMRSPSLVTSVSVEVEVLSLFPETEGQQKTLHNEGW